MLQLPKELVREVALFLDAVSLFRLACTSHGMRDIIYQPVMQALIVNKVAYVDDDLSYYVDYFRKTEMVDPPRVQVVLHRKQMMAADLKKLPHPVTTPVSPRCKDYVYGDNRTVYEVKNCLYISLSTMRAFTTFCHRGLKPQPGASFFWMKITANGLQGIYLEHSRDLNDINAMLDSSPIFDMRDDLLCLSELSKIEAFRLELGADALTT